VRHIVVGRLYGDALGAAAPLEGPAAVPSPAPPA
jgi:hypothetical protein